MSEQLELLNLLVATTVGSSYLSLQLEARHVSAISSLFLKSLSDYCPKEAKTYSWSLSSQTNTMLIHEDLIMRGRMKQHMI
jgi:hypothetical protein